MKYLFLLFPFFIFSQESINCSGNSTSLTLNGSITYSIGQIINTTVYDSEGNKGLEGVQVPYELDAIDIPTYSLIVSPNPSNNLVFLLEKSSGATIKEFNYELYSENASLISNGKLFSNDSKSFINLKKFQTSVYFLKISNTRNNFITTFKLLRN